MNWLKLHDHNPLYTRLVDKYEVKEYVENIEGSLKQNFFYIGREWPYMNVQLRINGELMFYHFSGFMPFQLSKWDAEFGRWIKIPLT